MKTNRSARWIVRIRGLMICLALVGMVGVAFWSGKSLAARVGPTTSPQTECLQIPKGSLADLIAAAQ
jgi:hypothetical protein